MHLSRQMKPISSESLSADEILESRRDIARRLHVNPKTVARAEARGELTAIKFNSRLTRYRRSEVDRWIAAAQA